MVNGPDRCITASHWTADAQQRLPVWMSVESRSGVLEFSVHELQVWLPNATQPPGRI